jgi:uncharacterized protein (TIGR03083 family)
MDFLDSIRQESDRFYAIAEGADPNLPVPSCPDWTVADLVWHLGEVHWFWGTDVEMRATDPEAVEQAKPARPATYADILSWGRAQADRMIRILAATPDDLKVWTWGLDEGDQNARFVRRHQVQEAAVHRWDIENAVTRRPQPVGAREASDAIDEILAVTLPWSTSADKPLPGSVHIHCTDVEGEWFVHPDGRVEQKHAKADVAIRGTASDGLLGMYDRVPFDQLDIVGDGLVAREFLARINTE